MFQHTQKISTFSPLIHAFNLKQLFPNQNHLYAVISDEKKNDFIKESTTIISQLQNPDLR